MKYYAWLFVIAGTFFYAGNLHGEKKIGAASSRIIGHICDEVEWGTPACQLVSKKAGEVLSKRDI